MFYRLHVTVRESTVYAISQKKIYPEGFTGRLSQQRVNLYFGTARVLLTAQGDGYYAALHTVLDL